MSDRLLSRRQAAAKLGISVATLDRLTKAGHIRAVRIGPRTVRYEPEAVHECLRPKECFQRPDLFPKS